MPVPIDTWEAFDRLFAWDSRPVASGTEPTGATYLGRRCARSSPRGGGSVTWCAWGSGPLPRSRRRGRRHLRRPADSGFPQRVSSSPVRPAVLVGRGPSLRAARCLVALPAGPPRHHERRSNRRPSRSRRPGIRRSSSWSARNRRWAPGPAAAGRSGSPLRRGGLPALVARALRGRDACSLAAAGRSSWSRRCPSPSRPGRRAPTCWAYLDRTDGPLRRRPGRVGRGLASAFVQLVYPWVRTAALGPAARGLEPPDGVLVRPPRPNRAQPRDVPQRRRYDTARGERPVPASPAQPHPGVRTPGRRSLVDRVSLFGPVPGGAALLSDVTTHGESYRPAGIGRLVGGNRASRPPARRGHGLRSSGEALWRRLHRPHLAPSGLLGLGALRGTSPARRSRCAATGAR